MRILWVSNAPWSHSGYGSQTRQVGKRLVTAGHHVEFSANDGSRGDVEWEGLLVRGSGTDRYSRDTVREDVTRSQADWTIVLYDPWVFVQETPGGDPFKGLPHIAAWAPIDHYPVPPTMLPWLAGRRIIAMSEYGHQRLLEASAALARDGEQPLDVRYAPHAVEPVFTPTPYWPATSQTFREMVSVPEDAFLVGIVAANIGTQVYDRKGWGDMLQAVAVFMAGHPDAYLYIHSLAAGQSWGGVDLPSVCRIVGVPLERVIWADQYAVKKSLVTDAAMAAIYSSFDVLLSTSRGEGFGLPVLEAQACGTPVIVSNWTAQPELVGEPWDPDRFGSWREPSGWIIACDPDMDHRHGALFAKPRLGEIVGALEDAYSRRGNAAMREAAVAKASNWAADRVFETYWRPILDEMEADLAPLRLLEAVG